MWKMLFGRVIRREIEKASLKWADQQEIAGAIIRGWHNNGQSPPEETEEVRSMRSALFAWEKGKEVLLKRIGL